MEAVKAVQQAIEYMEDHLGERIEPDRIAEAAYMSLPNLYRVFYALTGHPLVEYIRKRRIHQAAIRLRHSNDSVLEVAFDCGFDSYRTFANVFKKFTGLTPGMYRRAASYYSFERVNVLERVHYSEDGELSGQYPDVKVIRAGPMLAIAYRHTSPVREGLEEATFRHCYDMLSASGFAMETTRLIGFEPEPGMETLPESGTGSGSESGRQRRLHEYVILTPAPSGECSILQHPDVFMMTLPSGLYAVSKTPEGPPSTIIAAWNRVLAEWLPRSSFTLGDHPFVEEFHHHRGKVTRIKLFLPVVRKHGQETIGIADLPPVRLLAFRALGGYAQSAADDQLTAWLMEHGMAGDARKSLYMSYSYRIVDSEESDTWYELGVSIPDNAKLTAEDAGRVKWLEGGLYACITTAAYGVMTGVVDMLHEWLVQNDDYRLDDRRSWFAKYLAGVGADLERSTTVACYLPVVRVK